MKKEFEIRKGSGYYITHVELRSRMHEMIWRLTMWNKGFRVRQIKKS